MSVLRNAIALFVVLSAGLAAAQSRNPMDFVGEQHNIYLDCLRRADPASERNPFEVLVRDCGFDPGMPAEEFIRQYTELMPPDLLAPLDKILEPYRKAFNDEQYAYLQRTELILATQAPEEAARSLAELEASAVASLGESAADLAVLGGLSTARHSLRYWQGSLLSQPGVMRAKWWQVVLGDVAGGIVGGIFGGGVGAVGLGTACSKAVASL